MAKVKKTTRVLKKVRGPKKKLKNSGIPKGSKIPLAQRSAHRRKRDERDYVPVVDTSWVEPFLEFISSGMTIRSACRMTPVSNKTFYKHKRLDENFQKMYEEAWEKRIDLLEESTLSRCIHGVEEPIMHEGSIVAHKVRYPESTTQFMLKRNRKKYEDLHAQGGGNPEEQAQLAIAALRAIEEQIPNE